MKVFGRYGSVVAYALLTLALAVADALSGVHFSFWVLYFVPIGLATWNLGARIGGSFALFTIALLLVTALAFGHPYSGMLHLAWVYCSRAIAYAVLVFLVSALRKKEIDRLYMPPPSGPPTL